MIPHKLSLAADQASQRYDNLTRLWQGLFIRMITHPDFGAARLTGELVEAAYADAQTYLDTERAAIDRELTEIAVEAHRELRAKITSNDAENLSDAALEHLSDTREYILDEIIAQIHRDIAFMRNAMQRMGLEIRTIARARRITERRALVEYRLTHSDMLDFVFQDRRGRRTPSRSFIRLLWRQTALAVFNEVVMLTLSDHSIDRAAVMHLEEGVAVQVDTLVIGGDGPTYSELRNTYFHPNANAWLDLEEDLVSA